MRDVERADHLLLVLCPLLRRVRDHDERAVVQDLVEALVGGEDLVQRFDDGDAIELDGEGLILELRIVRNVDPREVADEVEDIPQAGVGELNQKRLDGGRAEQRRLGFLAGLLAQLLNRRPRPRRFDLISDRAFEIHHLCGRLAIGGIVLAHPPVFEEGCRQLPLLLELPCCGQMRAGRVEHSALERDLVLGAIRILLQGSGVVDDGGVPVPRPGALFASAKRPSGRTA